ncbi:MAG: YesL family protein [Clostridiales bacterium]
MPLFFNFTKPGPGVPEIDDRTTIKIFFDIYFRKFSKFISINFLTVLCNFPAIIVAFVLSGNFIFVDNPEMKVLNISIMYVLMGLLVCFPILTIGPFQAGLTYILRNYAREEHSFILSDFKEQTIKNFKQGLIVSFIDFLFICILIIEFKFYGGKSDFFSSMTIWINIFVFTIYSMMHMYIYQMMITVELTIIQLYKNALIFTLMKFLKNILIYIICAAIIFALAIYPIIGVIFFIILLPSTIGFIINFHAYPTIKKFLIEPAKNKEDVENKEI